MRLFEFYGRHAGEVWLLLGQHIALVAISTALAALIGLPLGVLVARRPAWRRPVLGFANVFQTIPSLALFGLLIPVFGIGAWTAITALVVYALPPSSATPTRGLPAWTLRCARRVGEWA